MDTEKSDRTAWTVGEVLKWTAARFVECGFDSARLDAELLLASVLGCDRVGLYIDYHKPLTGEERGAYRQLVIRRQAGEPVAYLVGHKEFWSLRFDVDPRVLVPRPETELLVEISLARLQGTVKPRLVDVGTGCGAVAVALAKERPDARVTATDIDEGVLELARMNAGRNGVEVRCVQGPFLQPVRGERFHLVVSNPPYVATSRLREVDPNVLHYEPRSALVAGDDGLDVIRELAATAPDALLPGGWLVMEMDPGQEKAVRELAECSPCWSEIEVRTDLAGRPRAVVLRLR